MGVKDWYIAANLENKKNLNNHLLKNLIPLGIPKELKKQFCHLNSMILSK